MDPPTPLAPIRFGPTQKRWPFLDGTSMRPGYHLTPFKLFSAFRQAEMGAPLLQCDVFEDILENDGHLRGQYESRLSAVAHRPWLIQPGGKGPVCLAAASALASALKRTNMLPLLWHLMEAVGYGWSGANTVWELADRAGDSRNVIVPTWFLLAPHRRFLISEAGMGDLTFRTELNQWPGDTLYHGEWIVARRMHRLVMRAGLFRTTSWWALFKRLSITDWIVFAEKFGIPIVLGTYSERASPETRAALEQAVVDIGTDGQAVLSELTKILIGTPGLARSGDVSSLHPAVAARCDAEMSKVITGATLNVETGGPGSFALGKVHQGRAQDLVFADALWLQESFQRHVIVPFIDYNPQFAGAELPRLVIRVRPEMAPEIAVKVYGKLQAMGLEIEVGDALKPLYEASPPTPPNPTADL
jgi:phage gp29-like protein